MFKILNFSIFGGFKKGIFLDYDEIVDIFWYHHKTGIYFMSFIYILGDFLKVKVQNRNIFFGGC